MKRLFCTIISLTMLLGLFAGCSDKANKIKPKINYTEVCDISSYKEKKIDSVKVGFSSFSIDKLYNIYAVSDGLIRKFSSNNILKDSYDGTENLTAPYWYDGYVYAYGDSRLVKISEKDKEISTIADNLPLGFAQDIVVADNTAYLLLNVYGDGFLTVSKELWQVNIASGAANKTDISNVSAAYASEGGKIYALAYTNNQANELYSISGGEPELLGKIDVTSEIMSFVLEDGWLYYSDIDLDINYIFATSLDTLESAKIEADAGVLASGAMRFRNGNIVYVDSASQTLKSIYILAALDPSIEITICDENYTDLYSSGYLNYSKLAGHLSSSDMKLKIAGYSYDEIMLKILAADSDVDIIILSPSTADSLISKGFYKPIESEIISVFNESCFDYINSFTKSPSGETVLVPLDVNPIGMMYPKENLDKAGLTAEDAENFYEFIDKLRNDSVKSSGLGFYADPHTWSFYLGSQYNEYYCNKEEKEMNFETETYKEFYSTMFDGWLRSESFTNPTAENASPDYITNIRADIFTETKGLRDCYNPQKVLLSVGGFDTFAKNCNGFFEDWRALPLPKIGEEVKGTYVSSVFAYINPFSKHYDEAVKALELICSNYFELTGEYSDYSLMFKDIKAYGEKYHTDSDVFKDMLSIAENGFILEFSAPSQHSDVDEYQSGRATLDKAIKMYQREVNIWLNE